MNKNINKIINILTVIIVILFFLSFIKLPYEIMTTGGLLDLKEKMNVKNYNCSGKYSMVYVTEIDSNVLTYLISLINPNWDSKKITKENIDYNANNDEINYRGKILLEFSNQTAIMYAYKLANKKINITDSKFAIIYKDSDSKTNLKVKDEILSINNIKINDYSDIKKIIATLNPGDTIKFNVKNGKKKYNRVATLNKDKKIGIMIIPIYKFDNDVDFNFENNESGSSGGMMMTLALYDILNDFDLAKGRNIAGTGTIEDDGKIGKISGLKYKLKAAVENNVDIFLVSKYNYKEAIKLKKENNYKIKIVKVNSIEEAIEYLKK